MSEPLAKLYCEQRGERRTPPAPLLPGDAFMSADAADVSCLRNATFLADGLTVILADGTIAHRNRGTWYEVDRGKA